MIMITDFVSRESDRELDVTNLGEYAANCLLADRRIAGSTISDYVMYELAEF